MDFEETHTAFKNSVKRREKDFEKGILDFLDQSGRIRKDEALKRLHDMHSLFHNSLKKIDPKISDEHAADIIALHTFGTFAGLVERGLIDPTDGNLKKDLPNLYAVFEYPQDIAHFEEVLKNVYTYIDSRIRTKFGPKYAKFVREIQPTPYTYLETHVNNISSKKSLVDLLNFFKLRFKIERGEELTVEDRAKLTRRELEKLDGRGGSNIHGAKGYSFKTFLMAATDPKYGHVALQGIHDDFFPYFRTMIKEDLDPRLSAKSVDRLIRAYTFNVLASLLKEGRKNLSKKTIERLSLNLFKPNAGG